jgi:hypothetical protein
MPRRTLLIGTLALTVAMLTPAALAAWSSTTTAGPLPVSTATITAPTGAAATTSACTKHNATTVQAAVTWTPTTSTGATGYTISRSTSVTGPFTQVGSVGGINTTGWTDTTTQLQYSTTYYYVIDATVASWTSPDSNPATVLTPDFNCHGGT